MTKKFWLSTLVVLALGCSTNSSRVDICETIDIGNAKVAELSKKIESVKSDISYMVLGGDSAEYAIRDIDKIIYNDHIYYILDSRSRKIVSFNQNGEPCSVLDKQGRGPEEYIQITDFDVDENGGLWILDGNKDAVMHYGNSGKLLSETETESQYSYLKCLNDGLLLGVSPWDASENSSYRVVKTDTCLTVNTRYSERTVEFDPNFGFPSTGFSCSENHIFYNNPIDDNVCTFESDGTYLGDCFFNFSTKRVPDDIRKNIEPKFDRLDNFCFLTKAICVTDKTVVAAIREDHRYKDFILEKESSTLYLADKEQSDLFMLNVSGGMMIYMVSGTCAENPDSIVPEEIRSQVCEGNIAVACLPVNKL